MSLRALSQRAERFLVNMLKALCFFVVTTHISAIPAFAQSQADSERDPLAGRLAMLDPNNQEEYASQVDSLRLSIQEEANTMLRDMVECYLALVGNDRQALTASIAEITAKWDDVPNDLRPTILRLGLVIAIEASEEKRGESIYKELTRVALRDDVSVASRRESADLIGFLNGLLGTDDGIISAEVRTKAESLLNRAKGADKGFSIGQQNGNELRTFLDAQRTDWEHLEPSVRASQIEQFQLELDEIEVDHESKLQEAKSENADQREIWTTTFATRKRLVGNLNLVIQDSYLPTPGHPGPPPVKPSEPNRDSIKVDEYETKKEKRGDKTVEVKERKSQSQIEREKDRKFSDWQRRYAVDKPIYDQNIATYRPQFQAWKVLDAMRRKELFDIYTDLAIRIDRIDKEKAAVDQAKKEAMEEIDRLSKAIKELRRKIDAWKHLEEGILRREQDFFIRASAWEGIDSQTELQQMLRWIRTVP